MIGYMYYSLSVLAFVGNCTVCGLREQVGFGFLANGQYL